MNALSTLRATAATVTLLAGLLAVTARFGPLLAPDHHEAAMIALASALGEEIGPDAAAENLLRLAAY